MMTTESRPAIGRDACVQEFFGDLSLLTDRIGVKSASLVNSNGMGLSLKPGDVVDTASLAKFVRGYRTQVLAVIELPGIIESSQFTERGELRELVELDRSYGESAQIRLFSEPSRWIGHCHARRLQGMRDHRTVWRYCDAIRQGKAFGWHFVIYGIVLGAFAVPLRQGLAHYSQKILRGFLESAAPSLKLEGETLEKLALSLTQELSSDIENALAGQNQVPLRSV
ncbi:MAG: Urease accessory protein UreF [Verrucomicrobia subdivision 3 bacterium]|nr:Urease accessory protein UreF [Limisphaerales bacterium]MCS1416016.1 Urease accessory protein UreF [Limisphaerales bacterium]